jgi:hypothetical protein
VFVVVVWSTPLASGAVFVVVEEDETLQLLAPAHVGTAPALIRSICASLSVSAANAVPPPNKSAIRQGANQLFIRSSRNGLRSR